MDINYFSKKFPTLITTRAKNSHKGTFGTLTIIGGKKGMEGACLLSGHAALKIGTGKVIIGLNQNFFSSYILEITPEIILKQARIILNEEINRITAWVIGGGLGVNKNAKKLIGKILKKIYLGAKVLIDADALNILSTMTTLPLLTNKCVITPHPKEAAKLLKCTVKEIQLHRKEKAKKLAEKMNCWVVLKGYKTIIVSPKKKLLINTTGGVSLATAGTGDVLSGVIGGLLAQGVPLKEAIIFGVWVHGRAADSLVKKGIGPIGITAHEIINEIRILRNKIYNLNIN